MNCATCTHWHQRGNEHGLPVGECHLLPPVLDVAWCISHAVQYDHAPAGNSAAWVWPITDCENTCSRWSDGDE